MGLNVTSQPPATVQCTGTPTTPTGTSPCVVSSVGGNPVPVGQTAKIMTAAGGYSGRVQVIVVGLFNDGSNQVLLDTYV